MTLKNITLKLTAALLSCTMLFGSLPQGIYAVDTAEPSNASAEQSPQKTEREGLIIAELYDERTANEKHFMLDDDTMIAAQYPNAVHFENIEGKWEDIDNTLKATPSADVEAGIAQGYEVTANAVDVTFAKTTGEDTLLSLGKENTCLRWSFMPSAQADNTVQPHQSPTSVQAQTAGMSLDAPSDAVNLVEAKITNPTAPMRTRSASTENVQATNEEKMTLPKISSKVRYENILDGVDLEYNMVGDTVKENIIVKERRDSYSYRFGLHYDGLTYALEQDGSIRFSDIKTEETVFTLPAPFMIDAAGSQSHAVSYQIDPSDDGILLTIAADADWVNAAGRQFPVTIDPIVETQNTSSVQIVSARTKSPTTNLSASGYTRAVGYDAGGGTVRLYAKVTLPSIGDDTSIVACHVSVGKKSYNVNNVKTQVNLHQITDSWGYNTITWNNKPGHASTVEDYCYFDNTSAQSSFTYFDITNLAKQWHKKTAANHGFVLKTASEPGSGSDNFLIFYEHNDSTASRRPILVTQYIDRKGLEDFWSYSTFSAGGGMGYINNQTGAITYVHEDFAEVTERMPLSIKHVYNSNITEDIGFGKG